MQSPLVQEIEVALEPWPEEETDTPVDLGAVGGATDGGQGRRCSRCALAVGRGRPRSSHSLPPGMSTFVVSEAVAIRGVLELRSEVRT